MDADNVLVRDLAGEQKFTLEPSREFRRRQRVRRDIGSNDLQRDRNPQLLVPRLIHRSHAAGAEQSENLVAGAKRMPYAERSPARGGRHAVGWRSWRIGQACWLGSGDSRLVRKGWGDDAGCDCHAIVVNPRTAELAA